MKGCLVCNHTWHDHIPAQAKGALPPWQVEFEAIRNKSVDLQAWWSDLSSRLLHEARPEDHFIDKIHTIPKGFDQIVYLLSRAYGYDIPKKRIDPKGFVTPRRLKYPDSLVYHCKAEVLAQEIGIPENGLCHFIQKEMIKPIHFSPVIRDMFFDIRDAQNIINLVKIVGSTDKKYFLLEHEHSILKMHKINYGGLVCFCITEGIRIYRFGNDLSKILICKNDLLKIFETLINDMADQLLSKNSVANILGVAPAVVVSILIQGHLTCGHHSSTCHRIQGSSLLSFLNSNHPITIERSKRISHLLDTV